MLDVDHSWMAMDSGVTFLFPTQNQVKWILKRQFRPRPRRVHHAFRSKIWFSPLVSRANISNFVPGASGAEISKSSCPKTSFARRGSSKGWRNTNWLCSTTPYWLAWTYPSLGWVSKGRGSCAKGNPKIDDPRRTRVEQRTNPTASQNRTPRAIDHPKKPREAQDFWPGPRQHLVEVQGYLQVYQRGAAKVSADHKQKGPRWPVQSSWGQIEKTPERGIQCRRRSTWAKVSTRHWVFCPAA